MERTHRLGHVVVEAALIATGIVLALAAESWWSSQEAIRRSERAVAAVKEEMRANSAKLLPLIAYHDSLGVAFGKFADQEDTTWDEVLPSNFRGSWMPELSSGNWNAAVFTGALEAAPDSVVSDFAEAYALQDFIGSFSSDMTVPLAQAFSQTDPSGSTISLLSFFFRDLSWYEQRLYDRLAEASGIP